MLLSVVTSGRWIAEDSYIRITIVRATTTKPAHLFHRQAAFPVGPGYRFLQEHTRGVAPIRHDPAKELIRYLDRDMHKLGLAEPRERKPR